jgi:hypothetical protein
VDDRRPQHPQDPLAGLLDLAHLLGDLVDDEGLRLLAGHLGLHEREPRAGPPCRGQGDADAGRAAHQVRPGTDVAHRDGPHRADLAVSGVQVGVHDDAAVHLGVLHLDPALTEPDRGRQVGRGVEVRGEDAVALDRTRRAGSTSTRLAPWVCSRMTTESSVRASGAVTARRTVDVSVASLPTSKRTTS